MPIIPPRDEHFTAAVGLRWLRQAFADFETTPAEHRRDFLSQIAVVSIRTVDEIDHAKPPPAEPCGLSHTRRIVHLLDRS